MSEKNKIANSILLDAHKITVDWLKFSEAKLLGLAGVNLLFLFGIHRLPYNSIEWTTYKIISTAFILISIAICFLAIIPRMGKPTEHEEIIEHHHSNDLLFYGDISKYPKTQYQQLMKEKLGNITEIDEWYTGQIWSISRITMQKLSFFRIASWIFVSVLLTPIGAYILRIFSNVVSGEFLINHRK